MAASPRTWRTLCPITTANSTSQSIIFAYSGRRTVSPEPTSVVVGGFKAVRKLRWVYIVHFCVVVVIICPKADELMGIHQRWKPVNVICPEQALLPGLFGRVKPVLND